MIKIEESKIPIKGEVRALSDMLGIDPLVLACEGRVVLAVSNDKATELLDELHNAGYKEATIIGEAKLNDNWNGLVLLKTKAGGLRILEKPVGEITPRIC